MDRGDSRFCKTTAFLCAGCRVHISICDGPWDLLAGVCARQDSRAWRCCGDREQYIDFRGPFSTWDRGRRRHVCERCSHSLGVLRITQPRGQESCIAWRVLEDLPGCGPSCAVTTFSGLITLRLLSGIDYLRAFDPAQLRYCLARLFVSARGLGFDVGFMFLGLGSTVFAYLLFQSRYVHKALAGWGIFASLAVAIGSLATILFPWFAANVSMTYMVPMFLYEVPLGLWFLVKGVRVPTTTGAFTAARQSVDM